MANNITAVSVENDLVLPGGIMKFDRWDDDDNPTGLYDMGETEETTINITQEVLIRQTQRTASRAEIARKVTSTTRQATLTTLSITKENLAFFMCADESTITQAATPVTDEEIMNIQKDREYYFGVTAANPVGIIGATSISLTNFDSTKIAWAATTAYTVGTNVEKVADDGTVFRVKTAGTSDASEPTWVTTTVASYGVEGSLTTDGTVVWEYIAAANDTYTATTDYDFDDTSTTGARFKWLIDTTEPRYVYANYTPTANSRTRVNTGANTDCTGTLVIETANDGVDRRYVMPKVRMTPSGDLALVNDGSAYQNVAFECSILEDGSKAAIYIDGMPV